MSKVFVSGCYDILHGGHVEFFKQAKKLGDYLVVCIASDESLMRHKNRKSSIPLEHKIKLIESLKVVDKVVVSSGNELGLDFAPEILKEKPETLAVTHDDKFEDKKRKFCLDNNIKYLKIPKTLNYEAISTSDILSIIKAPREVPLRVDFAGGWLDVPKYARKNSYIVNCAIQPLVSAENWPYPIGSGLGGSAAYSLLTGENPINSELRKGVGWQDPAVIMETGICAWHSGETPKLYIKRDPSFLREKMAIIWTGKTHNTPGLVDRNRDYDEISFAGSIAKNGVVFGEHLTISWAINKTYKTQIKEGMRPLRSYKEVAKKYCGGGHGGYALYFFDNKSYRDDFLKLPDTIAIEPFMSSY